METEGWTGNKTRVKDTLPIDAALPELIAALSSQRMAVLQAPPGAGKTTRVPLAMLDADIVTGKILMLEPRRLAARAAAERMADTLGEKVGQTIGYKMRGETKTSKNTRIEVVTEGILTRMIQSDPELSGIDAIIFDEFHERSLNADLGLALALDVRAALREDLMLVVMSATLDGQAVARLMDNAPVVTSDGRSFPVETHWLDRPRPKTQRFEAAMADLIQRALETTDGSILAFLPGEGEIRRVQGLLTDQIPADCTLRPLFGAMPIVAQRDAIRPDTKGRKIVLATSIAETSLTIADIRVVVDGGLARRARFDPGTGMSRLVTERASKAEAEQRRGRAGRVAEGTCYRLWTKGEDGALPIHAPAAIEIEDLASFALDLALWGAREPDDLPLLTRPNPRSFAEARSLLSDLGALAEDGALTDHGKALAKLPLHPRLGHMLATTGTGAAPLAALLSDRDPLRSRTVDLTQRLDMLDGKAAIPPEAKGAFARIRQEAKRLRALVSKTTPLDFAQMAALAYPDRIGLRRPGDDPRWLLSGGSGVEMDPADPMASARLIVVTDTDGKSKDAKIRSAIQISEAALHDIFADQIHRFETCEWSRRDRKVLARRQEKLGAMALSDRRWDDPPPEDLALAMLDGVHDLGLSFSKAAARFRTRVSLLQASGADMPDMSDETLMKTASDWLLPHLTGITTADHWAKFDLLDPLRAMLTWDQSQRLDKDAPGSFTTPL